MAVALLLSRREVTGFAVQPFQKGKGFAEQQFTFQ